MHHRPDEPALREAAAVAPRRCRARSTVRRRFARASILATRSRAITVATEIDSRTMIAIVMIASCAVREDR